MSVRKRTDHGKEGSAGAAVIEKPTTTPETPTLLQSCYLDLPRTKRTPTSTSKDYNHPQENENRGRKAAEHDRELRRVSSAASERSSHQGRSEQATSVRTKSPAKVLVGPPLCVPGD